MTDNNAAIAGKGFDVRLAGIAMLVAATATVFLMAHHPVGMHGSGGMASLVHAGMMIALCVLLAAFVTFAVCRGAGRPLVLAGLVAYLVSTFAHLGAATINGIVVPALAARGNDAVSHDVFLLAWESNQALALVGVVTTGVAYSCWGTGFLLEKKASSRVIGTAGLLTGVLPAAALLGGQYRMTVEFAQLVYLAHAAWCALIGGWLIFVGRGERPDGSTAA